MKVKMKWRAFLNLKMKNDILKHRSHLETYRTAVSADRPQCYRLISIAGNAKYKQNNLRISYLI